MNGGAVSARTPAAIKGESGGPRHARVAVLLLLGLFGILPLFPQTALAQFGRNKVQYESFDFQVVQTEHFDVYFYEEEREAAVDAARMAERIYGRLSRILDHEFQARKPLILYASQTDFQQTNVLRGAISEGTGGVTETLKDRVILPITGSYAEFNHVLAHELVHAFQFDILKRGAVEASASPFAFVPSLWFMEGMAEYLSIGRIDAKTVAWVRDAALAGYLRTIAEMTRFNDFLSYRFGQSLWHYIGEKWGDETIGLLLKRSAEMGIDRAFERTLGITLAELTEEWHEAVRATHLPAIRMVDNVDEVATRLTDHAMPSDRGKSPSYIAPALSPDGRLMVYLSDRGYDLYSFFDLWLADARTGEPLRRLVKSARGADFESLRYLTSSAEFSPDGTRVAFVAKAGGKDAIYVIDVRSGDIERKWVPGLNGVQSPTWSPDGRRIAFSGLLGGLSDLYVWDLETGDWRSLTADRYADLHPAWSPDGRAIAFTTDRGPETDFERLVFGNYRIALYDLASGRIDVLPGQAHGDNLNPVWSPDGAALAFISSRAGVFNIYLRDLESGRLRQLTDVLTGTMGAGALVTSPALSWARRSGELAFSYFEEAGHNIYTIDEPWAVARVPDPPHEVRTVASQIGVPRMIESSRRTHPAPEDDAQTPSSYYLTDAGFRPSALDPAPRYQAEAEEAAVGQLSVAALMDSAGLALPDTAAFRFRDYRLELTPDLVGRPRIGAEVGGFFGNGVYGGSFITFSDMLGDHRALVAGDVQGSFDNARLAASYAYLKDRVNFQVSFVQYPFYRFLGRQVAPVPDGDGEVGAFNLFQRDLFRSVGVNALYPMSTFSRFEFGVSGSSIQTSLVLQGISLEDLSGFEETLNGETRAFVQPTAAWVYDNSLPGFTGPIAGRRWRIEASPAIGDLNMADVTADIRNYIGLPGSFTFASRLLSFTRFSLNDDNDAEDFELAWGGSYFLRGYDFGSFSQRECIESRQPGSTLFCPVLEQLIGSSLLLLNTELRFPILNPFNASWVPLDFPPIDGVLFADAGVVFTPGRTTLVLDREPGQSPALFREPLVSYGAGLRVNIYFAVLRLDYAVAPSRGYGPLDGIFSFSFGEMF